MNHTKLFEGNNKDIESTNEILSPDELIKDIEPVKEEEECLIQSSILSRPSPLAVITTHKR